MSAPSRFEDFAHPAAHRRETYQFRSTWLASSLRSLRSRSLLDTYRANLPERFHAPIFQSVVGQWLPVEIAVAHYASMDSLGLPSSTVYEMGCEIQTFAQSISAQFALRTSRSMGVTPWVILGEFRKLWERTWRGGDFAIDQTGPKDALLHMVDWTIAPSPYVRHAMRGVLTSMVGLFCEKAYVREVPEMCAGLAVGYRIAWA